MGIIGARRATIPAVAAAVTICTTIVGTGAAEATRPDYVALGDSYASGVGTRAYLADSGGCLRSAYAYPVIDAGRIGANLSFQACSGARVADVSNNQLVR